jgi:hypothetical protein
MVIRLFYFITARAFALGLETSASSHFRSPHGPVDDKAAERGDQVVGESFEGKISMDHRYA